MSSSQLQPQSGVRPCEHCGASFIAPKRPGRGRYHGSCGGEFAVLCACGIWGPFAGTLEIARGRGCEQADLERASAARGALVTRHER